MSTNDFDSLKERVCENFDKFYSNRSQLKEEEKEECINILELAMNEEQLKKSIESINHHYNLNFSINNVINVKKENSIESAYSLLKGKIPKLKYVVDPLIPRGSNVLVGGEQGSLKSWWGLDLGLSIVKGLDFLGFKCNKGKVWYYDCENGKLSIILRLNFLSRGKRIRRTKHTLGNYYFEIFPDLYLDTHEGKRKIDELIKEHNPDLVFIDTISRTLFGSENDVVNVREIFKNIRDYEDTSFVFLHHVSKSKSKYQTTMKDIRGSSDFTGMVDVVLTLQKTLEGSKMVVYKHRFIDVNDFTPIFFKLSKKGKGLKLEKCKEEVKKTKFQRCCSEILGWIHKKKIMDFKTKDLLIHTRELNFGKTLTQDCLNFLEKKGQLKKLKQGVWEVLDIKKQEN